MVHRGGGLPGYVSNIIWNLSEDRIIIYLINDYLSYLSYHNQIPQAIGYIMTQNNLMIPKLIASVELSKIVVTSTLKELNEKISEIMLNPEIYEVDENGLKFLMIKLQELGLKDKADLLKSMGLNPGINPDP